MGNGFKAKRLNKTGRSRSHDHVDHRAGFDELARQGDSFERGDAAGDAQDDALPGQDRARRMTVCSVHRLYPETLSIERVKVRVAGRFLTDVSLPADSCHKSGAGRRE